MPQLQRQPQAISRDELSGRFTIAEKVRFWKALVGEPVPPEMPPPPPPAVVPPSEEDSIRVLELLSYIQKNYLFVDDPYLVTEFAHLETLNVLMPGRAAILLAI